VVARIGEIVGLVGGGHPHAGLGAVVEHDLLGEPKAQIGFEEFAVAGDVGGQAVEVVEAAHVAAAGRIALGLVLQRRFLVRRRRVPFGVVIELDQVAVRIPAREGLAVAEIAVVPADVEARARERRGPPLQRLRAAGAERAMPEPRCPRWGELEGIALVVVPAAQIDAVALLAALGHAHDVDEEPAAVLEFRRQDLDMAEMGDVENGLRLHRRSAFRAAISAAC
jgi:hypothetical protein